MELSVYLLLLHRLRILGRHEIEILEIHLFRSENAFLLDNFFRGTESYAQLFRDLRRRRLENIKVRGSESSEFSSVRKGFIPLRRGKIEVNDGSHAWEFRRGFSRGTSEVQTQNGCCDRLFSLEKRQSRVERVVLAVLCVQNNL